jgi:hypothetical protein
MLNNVTVRKRAQFSQANKTLIHTPHDKKKLIRFDCLHVTYDVTHLDEIVFVGLFHAGEDYWKKRVPFNHLLSKVKSFVTF